MKITERILNLTPTNWTTALNIHYLKKYSKIDEKVHIIAKNFFSFLLHNQYAIAVSIWSYLLIEVGVATSTLLSVNSSTYGLEFCQNQFCDYWNTSHEGYNEFTPFMEFRCNSSHPEYQPFSSYKECTEHFYEYVSILQNSNDWFKACQNQFCEYWNDTHKIFVNSGATIKDRCNSSHPEYKPFSSYNECLDEFNAYASTIQDLKNWIETCQTQFCDYLHDHSQAQVESEINKKFKFNMQSICNSSYSEYSPFFSLPECMQAFHEYVSIFENPLQTSELIPLDVYWRTFCPSEKIINWHPKKIARYMAKCFKKLCDDYDLFGVNLDEQLYDWCTYKNKMQISKNLFRKILKKIKASETDQWTIESIIGIIVQSFESNIENAYSILGSLITENSQIKKLAIPDMVLLKTKLSGIMSISSRMIKDLIHVANIKEEKLSEKLIESLLNFLSDMDNIFS